MSIVYGPVPSWRLGRSLGIDLLSTKGKTCSFDCVYCQLGRTVNPLTERKQFVSLSELTAELERVKGVPADYATFSGVGEPTLASNLDGAIALVKSVLRLPVAVLTNSSLMTRKDVRRDLGLADVVVVKLDAPNEELFRQINRPIAKCTLGEIIQAIRLFRGKHQGKLVLQMMFIKANWSYAQELSRIAEELSPDEVQINTPLRPCAIQPLTPEDIGAIKREFFKVKRVMTVYEASRPEVVPLNLKETLRRRPSHL
ncbi:MAG: radical SAM protein [Chloroflexi bacterium]|nr:radical SAM protein [Chloroflexota bacterium]